MSDKPARKKGPRTAICFAASLAAALGVCCLNRHVTRWGTSWTNDLIWVVESPGRVVFVLVLACVLSWVPLRFIVR